VSERPVERSYEREFGALRHSKELAAEREKFEADLDRPPDKTLALVGEMPSMGHHGDQEQAPSIEWEDIMPMMNEMSTRRNMHWKLIDRDTGGANHDIRWSFRVGDRVKVRIVNEPGSGPPHAAPDPHPRAAIPRARARRRPEPEPRLEGHYSRGRGTDEGHPGGDEQPGHMDDPLPHRGAPGGRDDVQLRGQGVAAAVVRPRDACVVEAYSNRVDTD
jgi:hypothetical protein